MIKLFKRLTPRIVFYHAIYLREFFTLFKKDRGATDIFTDYYKTNFWRSKESLSGRGSSVAATKNLRPKLAELFNKLSIGSILDIPCGDYNWMKLLGRGNVSYIGADVVAEMITENSKKYADKNTEFLVADITRGPLPKVDLIFTRDCLVHLSYKDIGEAIRQIKSSGSKYFLTTSFPLWPKNLDIKTGHWRPVNLSLSPFNFPKPLEIIPEGKETQTGVFSDKSSNLYLVKDLPDLTANSDSA